MGRCVPPSRTCVSFCVASFVSQHWWLCATLSPFACLLDFVWCVHLLGPLSPFCLCICLPAWLRCLLLCFHLCVFVALWLTGLVAVFASVGLCPPESSFVSFCLQTSLFTFLSIFLHFFEFVSRLDISVDPPFVIHLFLVIALLSRLLLTAILSLLVSSSLLGSGEGWHGLGWGEFGSYVFAAEFACLFTATCSRGFWLSSPCFLTCPHACPVFVCLFTPLLTSLSRIVSGSYPGAIFLIVWLAVSIHSECVLPSGGHRSVMRLHGTAWPNMASILQPC